MSIRQAWPVGLPVLHPGPTDARDLESLGHAVTKPVNDAASYGAEPVGVQANAAGDAFARHASLRGGSEDVAVTADQTDSDGIRRRTVELTLSATPGRGAAYGTADLVARLVRAVDSQTGRCHAGLGRVERVEVLTSGPRAASPSGHAIGGAAVRARLVFACEVAA